MFTFPTDGKVYKAVLIAILGVCQDWIGVYTLINPVFSRCKVKKKYNTVIILYSGCTFLRSLCVCVKAQNLTRIQRVSGIHCSVFLNKGSALRLYWVYI